MDSFSWLLLNIATIIILAFFSMGEMAMVTFNKIRLQYYISQGSRKARWLDYLLSHPSRLFGTTLIGVNISMMLGSEFAREFHSSIGLDPDLAPLSQVFLVIIFGELAPQFAARRFSEHVAFITSPILYFCSRVMAPFVYVLGIISKLANRLLGGKETHQDIFLTLEELQKVLEDKDEENSSEKGEDFDKMVSNIFRLRNLTAIKAMTAITETTGLPANTTVGHLRQTLKSFEPYIPLYHHVPSNIVGILFIRDLVKAPESAKLRQYASSPWYITENTPILQVLKQFRKNKANVGCVINPKGTPIGILSLDSILERIFGKPGPVGKIAKLVIDITLPGDFLIEEFNKEFKTNIVEEGCLSLEDIFMKKFDQHPEEGEFLSYPPFELIVKECSLMDIKTIQIKTRNG